MIAIALAVGLVGLMPWIGHPLITREQELRVVLTARDMARGGDWIIPHYLGEPRLNKPPLMYWLTASVFKLAGTTQSAALARLPGALSGVLLLAMVVALGRRLVGRRAALLAAMMIGTSYLFLCFGRLCETDVSLACFESTSILALYPALTARHKTRWWILSGLLAGIGFLIKGPAALVLPLAAVLSFLAVTPRVRSSFRFIHLALWLAMLAALGAPWYLLAYLSRASQAAAAADIHQELGALLVHSHHSASPAFYLYNLPAALLPWSPILPFAVVALWRQAKRHHRIRFVLAWVFSSLLIMSAIRSKQIHYATLLIVPAALLMGTYLQALLARPGLSAARAVRYGLQALNALLAIIGLTILILPLRVAYLDRLPCAVIGVLMVLLGLAGCLTRPPCQLGRRFAAACLSLLLLANVIAWQLHEITEPSRMVKAFAARTKACIAETSTVVLAGRRLNAMQYYLDRPIQRATDFESAWQAARDGDVVILAADPRNPVAPPSNAPPPYLFMQQDDVRMWLYAKDRSAASRP